MKRILKLSRSHRRRILGAEYAAKVLGMGPIAYWPLDDPGSLEPDYLTFNGSSTQVNLGNAASINDIPASGGIITIEFWVKADLDDGHCINKADTLLTNSGWAIWNWTTSESWRFYVNCATSDARTTGPASSSDPDEWQHIVCYYNDTTKDIRVACNGVWGGVDYAGEGNYVSDAANILYFGRNQAGTGRLTGSLGWARISDSDRYDGDTPTNFSPPDRLTVPSVDVNTVGLWPMNEGFGSVAGDLSTNGNDGTISNGSWQTYPDCRCLVNSAQNGTYNGVTLASDRSGPFGTPAPFFDGVNDWADIYSASMAAAFDGNEGSISVWCKVYNSGVWTDGLDGVVFQLTNGAGDFILATKSSLNNSFYLNRRIGGVTDSKTISGMTRTDWFHVAITWSVTADEAIFYYDGAQYGSVETGLATWVSALNSAYCLIGAETKAPIKILNGWPGHAALFDRALGPGEIVELANP